MRLSGGMNSTDRCRPGPRAPTQFPPCGLGHRLADALGTAEPASAEGEEPLPAPSRFRRDEVASPTATKASPTTAMYATSKPAWRIGPRCRDARVIAMACSTSGSTSSAISRRPSRRRSSRGMVALDVRLAQQCGQPAACLEHVHLGRRVRAARGLRHLHSAAGPRSSEAPLPLAAGEGGGGARRPDRGLRPRSWRGGARRPRRVSRRRWRRTARTAMRIATRRTQASGRSFVEILAQCM